MNWGSEVSEWESALSWYPTAIKAYEESIDKKAGLSALDTELWTSLGLSALKRTPPHVSSSEYRRLVEWKLKRGKWRPRLQRFADELEPAIVKKASTEALTAQKAGKTRDAVKALVELRGCGSATASAVLAACDENVPFMGDELLMAVFDGQRDYTLVAYMKLVDEVAQKAKQLGAGWNARKIERAIFAAAVAKKLDREDELKKEKGMEKKEDGKQPDEKETVEVKEEKKIEKEVKNEKANDAKTSWRITKKRATTTVEVENVRKSARLSKKRM